MIYKNWSYKFFIYTIILNIIVAFLVIQSTVFNNYAQQINVCAIISAVFLILGIIFGIISYNKKEETDYKKKLGLHYVTGGHGNHVSQSVKMGWTSDKPGYGMGKSDRP